MTSSHPKARVLAALCCALALLALPAIQTGASEPPAPPALSALPETAPEGLSESDDLLSPAMAILAAGLRFDKSGLADRGIRFTAADFDTAAGMKAVYSITVLSLPDPAMGSLRLDDTPVEIGQIVPRADLGSLRFEPGSGDPAECSFSFGLVGCGPFVVECGLHLLPALNCAPTAERETLRTYENVCCFGSLAGNDPENDPIRFEIVSYPHAGILLPEEDGSFRYLPTAGYLGSDRFTYVCVDRCGGRSEPCEVKIKVEKNRSGVFYADMENHPAANAAVRLAEEGLFLGKEIAGKCYFEPEATLSGTELSTLLREAFHEAAADLPSFEDPTAPVTRAQAAALFDKLSGNAAGNGSIAVSLRSEDAPENSPAALLTRAEAALSLCALLHPAG